MANCWKTFRMQIPLFMEVWIIVWNKSFFSSSQTKYTTLDHGKIQHRGTTWYYVVCHVWLHYMYLQGWGLQVKCLPATKYSILTQSWGHTPQETLNKLLLTHSFIMLCMWLLCKHTIHKLRVKVNHTDLMHKAWIGASSDWVFLVRAYH